MSTVDTIEDPDRNNRIGGLKAGYIVEYLQIILSKNAGKVNTYLLIPTWNNLDLVTGLLLYVKIPDR